MPKRCVVVVLSIITILVFVGCGGSATTGKTTTTTSGPTASEAKDIAKYADEIESLHQDMVAAMDAAHNAEAAGDVAAAKAAKEKADDAYGKIVKRQNIPKELKGIEQELRECAFNMSVIAAFYEDATIARAEGDDGRYQDDMDELAVEISALDKNEKELQEELRKFTQKYSR